MTSWGSTSLFLWKNQIGPLALKINPGMVTGISITHFAIMNPHDWLLGLIHDWLLGFNSTKGVFWYQDYISHLEKSLSWISVNAQESTVTLVYDQNSEYECKTSKTLFSSPMDRVEFLIIIDFVTRDVHDSHMHGSETLKHPRKYLWSH